MISTIALVSGKGGSGKTLIAAALARVLAKSENVNVILLDTDLGTGGVSYYLGFKTFRNTGRGFADLVIENVKLNQINERSIGAKEDVQDEFYIDIPFARSDVAKFGFIPIGNHRGILKHSLDQDDITLSVKHVFRDMIRTIGSMFGDAATIVIADCRGGVDSDSLQICREVDDIIVISETDATSIQACQHLVDVMSDNDLSAKLKGFILNKVFDDPSQLAKAGASLFRCPYLGSLPFDIDAVRKYVSGELPEENALFEQHLNSVATLAFQDFPIELKGMVQKDLDFSRISLRDPNERTGSIFITLVSSYFIIVFTVINVISYEISRNFVTILVYSGLLMAMLGSSSDFNRAVGQGLNIYARNFKRLFKLLSKESGR